MHCVECHGNLNSIGSDGRVKIAIGAALRFNAEGGDLSKTGKSYDSLASYIAAEMPPVASSKCESQCAADVAAYMETFAEPEEVKPLACSTDSGLMYGKRTIRLLSSREYQNSLEDLLGLSEEFGDKLADYDGYLGGFVSTAFQSVRGQLAEAHMANAEKIASWATKNGKPFSCSAAATCASRFISETAYRAFRRPLTAVESEEYRKFFTSFGTTEGMEAALTTLLTSPQFLYRDEAGVSVKEAIEKGYYGGQGSTNAGTDRVEAESYNSTSPAAPFVTQIDNGRTVVVWPGQAGSHIQASDDAAGQLFYQVVATSSSLSLFATVNLPNATDDSFHYKLEGRDNAWAAQNSVSTNGYQEIAIASWNGLTSGQLYTLKIQRREDGAKFDAFRLTGGTFSSGKAKSAESLEVAPLAKADENAYVLTPYQFASALSFMFTGSLPDLTLLQAAQDDALTTPKQIAAQVKRLISSERGRDHFSNFVGAWMKTDDVTELQRETVLGFTPEVRSAMAEEVRALFRHVFYDDTVPFSEFYSADYTFVNRALGEFYGAQGGLDDSFAKTFIAGRGGILTSGAFMSLNAHDNRTAPILRAVDVRELMLCQHIAAPNAELVADRDAAQKLVEEYEATKGAINSRTFYELYTKDPACDGCHKRIINPLFGLEDFDSVGRIRPVAGAGSVMETLADGKKVKVPLNGTLWGVESITEDSKIDFVGTRDLAMQLSSTQAVKSCLIKKGFRFVTGLPTSKDDFDLNQTESLSNKQIEDYACAANIMKAALDKTNESPRAMFEQLGTLELIRFRK
ncbi:MAG: DUF1592 domain-containing protein [Marinagarivorans sp.]|nr:DUF1592 domain-containing protein [Marinagarivorans sp.]